VKDKIKIYPFY